VESTKGVPPELIIAVKSFIGQVSCFAAARMTRKKVLQHVLQVKLDNLINSDKVNP
jgi:hypothetical protein